MYKNVITVVEDVERNENFIIQWFWKSFEGRWRCDNVARHVRAALPSMSRQLSGYNWVNFVGLK